MGFLRRLVFSAVCAGLLTGLFVAVAHQIGTVPVILKAETYEQADAAPHEHASTAHDHEAHAWQPRPGVERIGYTVLADMLTAIGYGLLLVAGFALLGRDVTWRTGLWWGLAGFATFTLAPGLGLPPEVPGTEAAPLLDRQVWWVATVIATGAGLALLTFGKRWIWPVLAVVLIALPHLWGAPQPLEHGSLAPEALGRQFVVAVTVVSFLSWAVLGSSTAYFYRRFNAV
jgi:cobalt transporter subunit CbtA